jgi:type II secretory pathway pseudopilin PulG
MELILATAILAASGAALFGLIGQGSLFARRSQARAETLHLAQSALDEYLAVPDAIPPEGTFETHPEWAYRIRQEEIDLGVGDAVGAVVETAVPVTEGGIGGDVGDGGDVAAGLGNGVAATSADRVEAAVGRAPAGSKLLRVVIEVSPADAAGVSGSADPVCTLTRWVRVASTAPGDASAGDGSSEPQGEIVSEPVTTPGSDSEGGSR